jgi:hypothetical protein
MDSTKQFRYVYLVTNLVNNKVYVGQHSTQNIDDGYLGSGVIIRFALDKYGKSSFRKDVLCFCVTQKELDEKETFYIKEYDATNKTKGYNINAYGSGHLHTEEVKKRLQEIGREAKHKARNSQAHLGRKWYYNPQTGGSKLCYAALVAPWVEGRPAKSMRGTHTPAATKKWKASIEKTPPRSVEFRQQMADHTKAVWQERKENGKQIKSQTDEIFKQKMSQIVRETWRRRKENERNKEKVSDDKDNQIS